VAGADVREHLAQVCRVLAHHGMIDLWGHLSLRIPGSDRILATPRFSAQCLPRGLAAADLLVCDPSGYVVEGFGHPPAQLVTDLAVYRENPRRQACIFAAPKVAMAAAIAGYALKPLTHMESVVAFELQAESNADRIAKFLALSPVVQQPGIGAWAAGKDIFECLAALYHLEYLAQANLVVAGEPNMRTVAREDSDKLWKQFAGHHHYHEFFASLDPGPKIHPCDTDDLKSKIAFSCRALWERDTLVAFLEHISHRAPDGKHFFMSASKTFRDIGPEDICVLDYEANHIGGPKPPGFKWFHAQLLRERQDAQAVVHTHDVYGRAYALSPRKLVPSYRVGLEIATRRLPEYSRCDLIVDADVRRATLDALADGPVVHEIGHGTDFVSDTLEQATVDAIQREAFLEMDNLARQFGGSRPLPEKTLERIKTEDPSAADWWWFYTMEIGAPKRSAAGL
jgi:ribulose-5-phosphate 4-epimerase/fuculose-1-phosphate aldolase